jgi:hypothetical protein
MNLTQYKLIILRGFCFACNVAFLNKPRAFSTDRDNSNNRNPAVVYDNADTQKELIVKDNQRKAGIYR